MGYERAYRGIPYHLIQMEDGGYLAVNTPEMADWVTDNLPGFYMRRSYPRTLSPELEPHELMELAVSAMEQDIDEILAGNIDRTPSKTIRKFVIE